MNNLSLQIIAKLNNILSKNSIDGDLRKLDDRLHIKVLASLSKSLASRELKRELKELEGLTIGVGMNVQADRLRDRLKQSVSNLQQSVSDLEIGLNAPKTSLDIHLAESGPQRLTSQPGELFLPANVIRALSGQIKEAANATLTLEKAYAALAKAQAGLTGNDYATYLGKCNLRAQELATTQKTWMESTAEFSKSGYNLPTSEALAEKSIILSNIGNMGVADSAAAITDGIQAFATIDSYTDDANKAQALLDKYAKIDGEAHITAGEIARGVQNAGAAFADAGTSIDEFIALLAAGSQQYQDTESLASGLKTAALRIQGCTRELERMGEDTDGVYTSAEELQEKIKSLTNIGGSGGVDILEADGKALRNIYDIFLDISRVYPQMPDTDSGALLELLAGRHNMPAVDATLNNMPKAQEVLQNSLHADGAAQEGYQQYLQTAKAHMQQFQSQLVEAYASVMDSGMLSHAADLGSAVLDVATKTDLLKHSIAAIAALKIGQKIADVGGSLARAAAQMKTLGNAIQMAKALPWDENDRENALDKIGQSAKSLTDENLKLLLSQKELSDQDALNILQARDLNEEQALAKLEQLGLTQATNANTAANTANASSVNAMSGTFASLKASIYGAWTAMSALQKASIVFAAASTIWGVVSSAVSRHSQAEERAAQTARESADSYKESSSSIADYAKRYTQLRESLLAAKGDEEATYQIKQQLLELQTEINEKYGDEYERLNLVTDAYKDQADAIRLLNKEEANRFLNESEAGISVAKRNMESEKTYDLSYAIPKTEVNEKTLTEIAKKYADSGMSILDAGENFYIKLDANPKDAYQTINAFQTDVRNAAKELDNEHLFDSVVLSISSDSLNDAKDSLEKYQEIYTQSQIAHIASDSSLSADYNEAVYAVEAYNDAVLKSEDPFSDENVSKAWDKLQAIKQGIRENSNEWGQYSGVMGDVFSAANDDMYSFYQAMQKQDSISSLAENLRETSDTDLQAMANDGDNGDAFDKLYAKAKAYGLGIQDLISLLVQLGYAQEEISQADSLSFSETWDALDTTENDSLKTLKDDLLSLAETGQLTLDSFRKTRGSDSFLAQLGIGSNDVGQIEDVIGKVNSLVSSSSQLAAMKQGMSGLSENLLAKQQNPGEAIGADVLAGMDDGLKAQTAEWKNYESVLGNASSSIEEVQEATNKLATAYLKNNNFLANLTESEKDYYISQLKSIGLSNAEELVQDSLAQKYSASRQQTELLKIAKGEAADISIAEINALLMEKGASDGVTNAFLAAAKAKNAFSSTGIDLSGDIAELDNFIDLLFGTEAAMEFIELTGGYDDRGFRRTNGMSREKAIMVITEKHGKDKQALMRGIKDNSAPTANRTSATGQSANGASSEETKTTVKETFDFIETALSRIEKAIAKVRAKAEDTFLSFTDRSKHYEKTISGITEEIDKQREAYGKYTAQANSVGLEEKYARQARDGSMELETIEDDETKQKIRDFTNWHQKAEQCQDKMEELKKTQKELIQANFEMLLTKYDKLFSRLESKNNRIQNKIDMKEAWGFSAGKRNYNAMNKNLQSQISNLKKQNEELRNLKKTVAETSEAWYEYDSQIQSNNQTMQNLKKSMTENAKAAAALPKAKADKTIAAYDAADEQYDAKIDNAVKPEKMNSLIGKKTANIGKRRKAYNNAVKADKDSLKDAKKKLNNFKSPKTSKKFLKKIRNCVKSGKAIGEKILEKAYSLDDNGKLYNACLQYNAYLEALESDKAAAELYAASSKQEKAGLALEKFSNIATGHDYGISANARKKATLQGKISLDEAQGKQANLAYYKGLLSAEGSLQKKLISKRDALKKSLQKSVANGHIKKNSEEWHSMKDAIQEVTDAIDESILSAAELSNTIRQAKWDLFDASLEKAQRLNTETDFYLKLMEQNNDFTDDSTGEFTKFGNAALGLHKANYESYLAQAKAYADEYASIMDKVKKGEMSLADEAVIERLRELQDAQRDSKLSAEESLSSIISLVKDGYDAQLDVLDRLIHKYKDLKKDEQNAYEYQKRIAEKTRSIATLQKQLYAYDNNSTEEARTKIQRLKVELEEARQDLEETEYDKYLSDMDDMLDTLYDDFESFLDEKLDNTDVILKTINSSVRSMSAEIIATLASLDDGLSPELKELLEGKMSSSEYVESIITNDKNAQEAAKKQVEEQEEAEKKAKAAEEIHKKEQELSINAQIAERQKAELKKQIPAEQKKISDAQKRLKKIKAEEQKQKEKMEAEAKAAKGKDKHNTAASGGETSAKISGNNTPIKDYSAEKKLLQQQIDDAKKNIKSYKRQLKSANAALDAYDNFKKELEKQAEAEKENSGEAAAASQQESMAAAPASDAETVSSTTLQESSASDAETVPSTALQETPAAAAPLSEEEAEHLEAVKKLFEISQKPPEEIRRLLLLDPPQPPQMPSVNVPEIRERVGTGDVSVSISQLSLPSVKNYEEFKSALIRDNKFEKAVQSMTIDRAFGGNSMAKLKYI